MATFVGNNVSSGDVIYAADHNELVTRIATAINNGLENDNISDTAAIATSKLADDAGITYAKLLSTIFSGQVQSQANAGTAGGTIYYVNLGGIKLAWGMTGSLTASGAAPASSAYVL